MACGEGCRTKKGKHGPGDFFWAAIVCLVERGLVRGTIARRFKRTLTMIKNWHAHSLQFAATTGLRSSNVSLATVKEVGNVLQSGPHCPPNDAIPLDICYCVENPTAMMEKQTYMQVNHIISTKWPYCNHLIVAGRLARYLTTMHVVGLQSLSAQSHLLHVWSSLPQAHHALDIWFPMGAEAQMWHKKKRPNILEM